MFRLVRLNHKWSAIEINYGYAIERRSIEMYVDEGHPVLLCNTMEEAIELLGADNINIEEGI